MVRVATLILVGVVLFLLIPGLCFMLVENWTYGEAVYYCFITLTTIGFGDFVAGIVILFQAILSWNTALQCVSRRDIVL